MGYFFLKKALMGYKHTENQNEADTIAWSVDEGSQLLQEWKKYKNLAGEYRDKILNLTGKNDELNTKVKELSEILQKSSQELKDLQELNNKIISELNSEQRKNANFLRICKERANADRGLVPKKVHNGYLELSRELIEITKTIKRAVSGGFSRTRIEQHKALYTLWRYRYQTPYLISLSPDVVKDLVLKDWEKMGISYDINFGLYEKASEIEACLSSNKFFNLSLNIKNGSKYWEIKFQAGKEFIIT